MNEFGCNLIIDTGDENPSTITDITGVKYSEVVLKGKPYKNSKGIEIPQKINQCNLWIYKGNRSKEGEGKYLNSVLEDIFKLLHTHRTPFEKVFAQYQKKHILCYGYYRDYHQYFLLNAKLTKMMGSFEIDVEFDIYFLEDE